MSWLSRIMGPGEQRIRVLVVMPNPADRTAFTGIAAHAHWDVRMASSCDSAGEMLKHHPADVIVCDRDVKPSGWREALETLAARSPQSRFILSTPATDDRLWLEVIERGGYDVVTTPLHQDRVIRAINHAVTSAAR
ncbi:MAG: response regulator [Acidobacteriota bacterium]|nr:response regulator [Acidobacteriota bacterium]